MMYSMILSVLRPERSLVSKTETVSQLSSNVMLHFLGFFTLPSLNKTNMYFIKNKKVFT